MGNRTLEGILAFNLGNALVVLTVVIPIWIAKGPTWAWIGLGILGYFVSGVRAHLEALQ